MAREGLLVLLCAGVVLGPLPSRFQASAAPEDDRDRVAVALAVQTALREGRELLLQNKPRAAVEVLERQLPSIDGNRAYLTTLRDAYRASIRELRLTNQEALARTYLQRLEILEPESAVGKDQGAGGLGASSPSIHLAAAPAAPGVAKTQPAPVSPKTKPPPATPYRTFEVVGDAESPKPLAATTAALASGSGGPAFPAPQGASPKPTAVRGTQGEEPKPFGALPADKRKTVLGLLAQADEKFNGRNYREAGPLYRKARQLDRQLADAGREREAYCILHDFVDRLNQPALGGATPPELESDVRTAIELAPRLDYARQLLCEIEKRQSAPPAAKKEQAAAIAVRHLEETEDGWCVAETDNFRIHHNQQRKYAELAARAAERTRTEMQRKWFGATGKNWSPRCEIYLHATGQDYSQATNVPASSPGHSSFRIEGDRVIGRRIDLHCDDPNLLGAVLPHEATHTVLAGNFGEQPIPRWADEGMAVLTEPREKVERHLRNLPKLRQDQQLFAMRQIVHMNDYPEGRYINAFYAQSVSLVEFLVHEKGPLVFTTFVREGMRGSYEAALQQHYGYRNFDELEQRWERFAFGESSAPGVAHSRP